MSQWMPTVVSGYHFDLREWLSNWTLWNFEVPWRGLGGLFFGGDGQLSGTLELPSCGAASDGSGL